MAYINSKSQWSYSLHVEYSKIGLIYVDSIGIVPRIMYIQILFISNVLYSYVDL